MILVWQKQEERWSQVIFQLDDIYIYVHVVGLTGIVYTDPVMRWNPHFDTHTCGHGKILDQLSFKDRDDALAYYWAWVEDPEALYMGSIM